MPNILFLGDIFGRPARQAVHDWLPQLRSKHAIDLVIANGENAASGQGLTSALAQELHSYGVDLITLGDHVWDQRKFQKEIDDLPQVCRPANLPPGLPGKSYLRYETNEYRVAVFTVLGRTFMKASADCPFRACDEMLEEVLHEQAEIVIVEIHAETTSEKTALGWYLDGRATMVVGTHTHIPTADAKVLPRGTAYQTDLGMSGPYASCIGTQPQLIIGRFLDGMPRKFEVANDDVWLCGGLLNCDDSGRVSSYRSLHMPASHDPSDASKV